MKSFKKALAVLLSVLMVAFSFPLSAWAIPNPNNPNNYWSTDYDVTVHAAVVDYTVRDGWGYDAEDPETGDLYDEPLLIMGDDVKSIKRSDLHSTDGTFALVFYVSGLDMMSSYILRLILILHRL